MSRAMPSTAALTASGDCIDHVLTDFQPLGVHVVIFDLLHAHRLALEPGGEGLDDQHPHDEGPLGAYRAKRSDLPHPLVVEAMQLLVRRRPVEGAGGVLHEAVHRIDLAALVAGNYARRDTCGTHENHKGTGIVFAKSAARRKQKFIERIIAGRIESGHLRKGDTIANVGGTNMPMAHYILTVTFNPGASAKPAAPAPTERIPKR